MGLTRLSAFKYFNYIIMLQNRTFTQTSSLLKGHSKWDNIKGIKGKKDAERSKDISDFLKKMKTVVKDGFDPKFNKKLTTLQQDYMKKSLPMDTFTKALNRLKVIKNINKTYKNFRRKPQIQKRKLLYIYSDLLFIY